MVVPKSNEIQESDEYWWKWTMALFDMQVNFVNCFELISKLDFYSWYEFQIIYNFIIVTLFIIILVIQNLLHFIFYNFGFNINLNPYNYKFRNVKKCSKIDGCNRKINLIQNFEIHLIKIFISFSKNLSFHCITIFFSAQFSIWMLSTTSRFMLIICHFLALHCLLI